jgi:hypothetical protein
MNHVNYIGDIGMGATEGIVGAMVMALILIAVGSGVIFALVDFSLMAVNRGFSLFVVWLIVLAAVHITSGTAILKGYDWVRILFTCSIPILIITDWLMFHRLRKNNLDVVLIAEYLAFLFFLVGPKAPSTLGREKY